MKIKQSIKTLFALLFIGFGTYILCHKDMVYDWECNDFPQSRPELFDGRLIRITTIPHAINYIDSMHYETYHNSPFDSFSYLQTTKHIIKKMFFHGNAAYDWKENWIAYLLGKYIWCDFNSIVEPEKIIKHCSAMCSQQTMLFARIMHEKGFTYRYVRIVEEVSQKGHFACEIFIDNTWHYVDVDAEPDWSKINGAPNQSMHDLIENNKLTNIYDSSFHSIKELSHGKVKIDYTTPNEKIGFKMIWVQKMTEWLSSYGLILLGIALLFHSVIRIIKK